MGEMAIRIADASWLNAARGSYRAWGIRGEVALKGRRSGDRRTGLRSVADAPRAGRRCTRDSDRQTRQSRRRGRLSWPSGGRTHCGSIDRGHGRANEWSKCFDRRPVMQPREVEGFRAAVSLEPSRRSQVPSATPPVDQAEERPRLSSIRV